MVYRLFDSAGGQFVQTEGLEHPGSWLGRFNIPSTPNNACQREEIEDGKGVYVEDERLPFKVRLELKEAMK